MDELLKMISDMGFEPLDQSSGKESSRRWIHEIVFC